MVLVLFHETAELFSGEPVVGTDPDFSGKVHHHWGVDRCQKLLRQCGVLAIREVRRPTSQDLDQQALILIRLLIHHKQIVRLQIAGILRMVRQ